MLFFQKVAVSTAVRTRKRRSWTSMKTRMTTLKTNLSMRIRRTTKNRRIFKRTTTWTIFWTRTSTGSWRSRGGRSGGRRRRRRCGRAAARRTRAAPCTQTPTSRVASPSRSSANRPPAAFSSTTWCPSWRRWGRPPSGRTAWRTTSSSGASRWRTSGPSPRSVGSAPSSRGSMVTTTSSCKWVRK